MLVRVNSSSCVRVKRKNENLHHFDTLIITGYFSEETEDRMEICDM
jgi:predicted hydrocarbon binding protein